MIMLLSDGSRPLIHYLARGQIQDYTCTICMESHSSGNSDKLLNQNYVISYSGPSSLIAQTMSPLSHMNSEHTQTAYTQIPNNIHVPFA